MYDIWINNQINLFLWTPLVYLHSLRFRLLFCALLELISFAEAYLKRSCEKRKNVHTAVKTPVLYTVKVEKI